jgi:hypothetical protein
VPASPPQILWLVLLPQLVVWPAFTVAAGLLGAGLARLLPTSGTSAHRTAPRTAPGAGGPTLE